MTESGSGQHFSIEIERQLIHDHRAARLYYDLARYQEELLQQCKDLEHRIGRRRAVDEFWRRLKPLRLQLFETVDDILYASRTHQLSLDATHVDPINLEVVPTDRMLFFKQDLLPNGEVAHVYSFESVRRLLQIADAHYGQATSPITRKSVHIYDIRRVDTRQSEEVGPEI